MHPHVGLQQLLVQAIYQPAQRAMQGESRLSMLAIIGAIAEQEAAEPSTRLPQSQQDGTRNAKNAAPTWKLAAP
jgi:hypothetical protein